MNFIMRLTRGCIRQDCQISLGYQSSTCLGWAPTYDKRGNIQGRDPNTTMAHYRCGTCGRRWEVESKAGERDKITTTPAPAGAVAK